MRLYSLVQYSHTSNRCFRCTRYHNKICGLKPFETWEKFRFSNLTQLGLFNMYTQLIRSWTFTLDRTTINKKENVIKIKWVINYRKSSFGLAGLSTEHICQIQFLWIYQGHLSSRELTLLSINMWFSWYKFRQWQEWVIFIFTITYFDSFHQYAPLHLLKDNRC